eukprot:5854725-Lingulodinium_polyedra.AAC.1
MTSLAEPWRTPEHPAYTKVRSCPNEPKPLRTHGDGAACKESLDGCCLGAAWVVLGCCSNAAWALLGWCLGAAWVPLRCRLGGA